MNNERFLSLQSLALIAVGILGLWFFMLRNCLLAGYPLTGDGVCYYYWTKYFFDALRGGEFPLWNPFHFWGAQDNFNVRFWNEYNPLCYLTLILPILGFSVHTSYILSIFALILVNALGLFLLGRVLFKDDRFALLAATLLLFSSLTFTPFFQLVAGLTLAPIIWFTFFTLAYLERPQPRYILGAAFCLMLVATTYIPFYFLTTFLAAGVTAGIAYGSDIAKKIPDILKMTRRQKGYWFLAIFSIGLAILPGLLWVLEAHGPEYFMNFRHAGSADTSVLSVKLETANLSGITNYLTLSEVFGWHDLGNSSFFYVSILVYFSLFLSAMNKITRPALVMFTTLLFILCMAVTDALPVHRFVFEHIFLFRLFRNNFFFVFIALPLLILFSVGQLQQFLNNSPLTKRGKTLRIFFLLAATILAVKLLNRFECLPSTYFSVGAMSIYLLILTVIPRWNLKPAAIVLLFILFLIEPLHVYSFRPNIPKEPYTQNKGPDRAEFRFTRPLYQASHDYIGYLGHLTVMEDHSGFIDAYYLGTPWTYHLQKNIPPQTLENYTRHKFYIYDQAVGQTEAMDWATWATHLSDHKNIALVDASESFHFASGEKGSQAQIITENSPEFSVEKFGVNFIRFKTNFKQDKFLVYNDSFHPQWHGTLNGKPFTLYRANYAFKGMLLPAGENTVELRYKNRWVEIFYTGLILYFFGFLFWLIKLFFPRQKKREP